MPDLPSHPIRNKRDAACGDAKLVPLGKLACKDRTLKQSSQDRITFVANLLEMSGIVCQPAPFIFCSLKTPVDVE